MAQVAIPIAATAFSVASGVQKGRAAKKAADSEAVQMEANARRRMTEGKAIADEVRRRTVRDMSDAQAIQASSGFSASDAQALNQVADIAAAGRKNELSYLYEAKMDAEALRRGADTRRSEGRRARNAAYLGAASTAIGGFGDIKSGWKSWQADRLAVTPTSAPVSTSTASWRASDARAYASPKRSPIIRRTYP